MNAADRWALGRLVGVRGKMRDATDDLQGLLLQVTLALLMVFIIAYFLFVDRQQKKQDEVLMDLTRQKLVLALEKTAEDYRIRYGLNALMTQGTDGRRTFEPDEHVRGGDLVLTPAAKKAFAAGSAAALTDYADGAALAAAWRSAVLNEAELKPDALPPNERAWLDAQVAIEQENVRLDVRGVQRALAARLQRQWMEHPEALPDVRDAGAIKAQLQERSLRRITEISGAVLLP